MSGEMRALCAGVHVLDVLVRPVEAIPEGQGGELVEEIRVTAAGSAGGTALVLAKLGAEVKSAGAIGTDAAGDMLLALLERDGVDTALLVRRDDVQTSASVLPIRPSGERPAFHVVGANGTFAPGRPAGGRDRGRHAPAPRRAGVHGRRGRRSAARARARARRGRRRPTCSRRASRACSTGSRPALAELDYLLPNDDQVLGAHRRGRPRGRLPRAARPRRGLRGRDLRRRRRADRGRGRRRRGSPPSRSRPWTPPAAATRSPPASCAGSASAATAADAARLGCAAAAHGRAGPRHRPRRLRPRRGREAGRLGRQQRAGPAQPEPAMP